jgi:DNA-binding response OmpR family regulator
VTRGGRDSPLTAKEYELLEYLLRHLGQVVSRDMLARDVWKDDARTAAIDNVIDVHVTRLRRKLDAPFETSLLKTVRGVGFQMKRDDK